MPPESADPRTPDHDGTGDGQRSRRGRMLAMARRLYLTVLAGLIVWLLADRHGEVSEMLEGARPALLAAALACSFGLILCNSALWRSALLMLGHDVPLDATVMAAARSLPARYVPLGVSYAAARMALLRSGGVPIPPLAITAGIELALSASVALAAGVGLLGAAGALTGGAAWTVAALAAATVAVLPALGGRAINRLLARRGARVAVDWRDYLRVLAVALGYWGWAAFTFVLYLRAFPAADSLPSVEIAGAFMVSWALGFLALLAPQGFGVAELSLVAILSVEGRSGVAVAAVYAGYRVVLIARDILAAGTAEIISTRRARRVSAPRD